MDALGYIDCGDNRDQTVFPWVRALVAEKRPATLLDFGCGDARFALRLAREHPFARVCAHERAPDMAAQARRRIYREGGAVEFLEKPSPDWTGRFDVILLQGVWMCWATRAECLDTLGLLARSLRPGGLLVAAITHPCFRDRRFETYRTDFDQSRYLDNGTPFTVRVGRPGAETPIVDYHWSLADTINQALESGLRLVQAREHADGPPGSLPSWLSLVFTPSGA